MKTPIALALVAAALAAPCARAQFDPGRLEAVSIDWLKSAYLACERVKRTQRVTPGVMQRCGEIAEHLRVRAFGADFEALLDWWEAERRQGAAVAGAPSSTAAQ